jgi:hypothetical protein
MKLNCGDSNCYNGWYRWNGSDYPCSECRELAEARKARAKPVHTQPGHDFVDLTRATSTSSGV